MSNMVAFHRFVGFSTMAQNFCGQPVLFTTLQSSYFVIILGTTVTTLDFTSDAFDISTAIIILLRLPYAFLFIALSLFWLSLFSFGVVAGTTQHVLEKKKEKTHK